MAPGPRWRALVDEAVGRGLPGAEVRRIVEHVTGVDDGAAVTVLDDEAPERQADRFDALVARRVGGGAAAVRPRFVGLPAASTCSSTAGS